MRRLGRRNARQGSGSRPLPVRLGIRAWWRSDSGIATATGVSSWTARVGGYTLTQATGTKQPAYTASNASLSSKPTLDFDATDELKSPDAASTWTWLHDAVNGSTAYVVYYHAATASLVYLAGTKSGANSNPGIIYSPVGTNVYCQWNGAAASTSTSTLAGYSAGRRWIAGRIRPTVTTQNAQVAWSGATTFADGGAGLITPTSADPDSAFRIAPSVAGPTSVAEVLLFPRSLSDAEHTSMVAYLAAYYGAF